MHITQNLETLPIFLSYDKIFKLSFEVVFLASKLTLIFGLCNNKIEKAKS